MDATISWNVNDPGSMKMLDMRMIGVNFASTARMFPERGSPNSAAVSREWRRPVSTPLVIRRVLTALTPSSSMTHPPTIQERRVVAHRQDGVTETSAQGETCSEGGVVLDAVGLGEMAERFVDEHAGFVRVENNWEGACDDRRCGEQLPGVADPLPIGAGAMRRGRSRWEPTSKAASAVACASGRASVSRLKEAMDLPPAA